MSLLLLLALAAQPSIGMEGMVIGDIIDGQVTVQERWEIQNQGKEAKPERVVIPLPEGAEGATVTDGFVLEGNSARLDRPLPAGRRTILTLAYRIPFEREGLAMRRTFLLPVWGLRFAINQVGGLTVSSQTQHQTREAEMSGTRFVVCEFAHVAPNQPFQIDLNGLPSRSVAPQRVVVFVCLAILVWMVVALRQSRKTQPLLEKRQEGILRAIARLDLEEQTESSKQKREALMLRLADAVREQEMSASQHRGT